jgi:hypothetical protein
MRPSPEMSSCIAPRMPVVLAHPERHGVVRDCTSLANFSVYSQRSQDVECTNLLWPDLV